jgi:hypothetical protein
MKKLMKAIAFATVMCMLLSTAAFAAGTAELTTTDYVLDVEVTTSNNAEQVALLIVKAGADLSSLANTEIAYVDQKATQETAGAYVADFSGITIADTFDTVDVYAGYASNTGTILVEEGFKLTNGFTELKVSIVENGVTIIDGATEEEGKGLVGEAHIGAAAAIEVNFEIPEGYASKKVVWAIRTATNGTYYTTPASLTGMEAIAAGSSVKLGVSFINGTVDNYESQLNITDVDAIFLFADAEGKDAEAYTDFATDNANKVKAN